MPNFKVRHFKDDLTDIIKAKMVELGLKVQDVADQIGYSYEGARKLISGKGSYWGVKKVCDVLSIDMTDVLKEN